MPLADASVVVCSYAMQRWEHLAKAVASIRAQSLRPREIVLVIDHNPDLLARAIDSFPDASVLANSQPRGLSGARNTGIAAAASDVVVFLDDDAAPDEHWLGRLLTHYGDESVLGVGGSAEPVWEAARPTWFPEEFDWVVGCSYRGMPTTAGPVRNLLGCNMSFRRSAFDVAGNFDTGLGRTHMGALGGEETEFCIRLQRITPGARLMYDPSAVVAHHVPRTRSTWRYYLSRCYAEGLSKAIVTRRTGIKSGLETESRYVRSTLPRAVWREVRWAIRRRDGAALLRAGAVLVGLLTTATGYVVGGARQRIRSPARGSNSGSG